MPTSPDQTQDPAAPSSPHDDDDGDDLQWDTTDGIDAMPGTIQTRSLNAHDRAVLASMRDGCSGIIGFLGAMALIIAIVCGLVGVYRDMRMVALFALCVVPVLAAVGLLMLKVDGKVRSDLHAGNKLIVSGRIRRMDSEEITGPGFLTVVTNQTPSRELKFFVEKRLYLQVKQDDLVSIAYVPLSKTILQLRTEHCRYCRRPDASKVGAGASP